jgi:beta-lactamase superfamily II metal-dependent hydrolase
MTGVFTLELLPARFGDAIWIEYGDPRSPHRILVDGGARSTTGTTIADLMSARIGAADPDFELIVLTHIDGDHITGLLNLFEDPGIALRPRDVWFNGWQHLPSDLLGAKQAERLSQAIQQRRLPWNKDFGGNAVRLAGTLAQPVPKVLPEIRIPGGMVLTLLSPTYEGLAKLRPVWKEELEKAGLVPGAETTPPASQADLLGTSGPLRPKKDAQEKFKPDTSEANGSSIAFVAEYDGRSALLTGDAHAGVLEASIRTLLGNRDQDKLTVDAFKLPHHGSKYNLSPELLGLIDTRRFLISTDGTSSSRHPDPVALARIVTTVPGARLEFNYATPYSTPWDDNSLKSTYKYTVVFPGPAEKWLTVRL